MVTSNIFFCGVGCWCDIFFVERVRREGCENQQPLIIYYFLLPSIKQRGCNKKIYKPTGIVTSNNFTCFTSNSALLLLLFFSASDIICHQINLDPVER
jgi:hypothetical protein